jgi:uncharacterized membrane protein HdeD (DUF308 family)
VPQERTVLVLRGSGIVVIGERRGRSWWPEGASALGALVGVTVLFPESAVVTVGVVTYGVSIVVAALAVARSSWRL